MDRSIIMRLNKYVVDHLVIVSSELPPGGLDHRYLYAKDLDEKWYRCTRVSWVDEGKPEWEEVPIAPAH